MSDGGHLTKKGGRKTTGGLSQFSESNTAFSMSQGLLRYVHRAEAMTRDYPAPLNVLTLYAITLRGSLGLAWLLSEADERAGGVLSTEYSVLSTRYSPHQMRDPLATATRR